MTAEPNSDLQEKNTNGLDHRLPSPSSELERCGVRKMDIDSSSNGEGIPIPLFLQPLFGFDVLPCNSTDIRCESPAACGLSDSPSAPERPEFPQCNANHFRGSSLTNSFISTDPGGPCELFVDVEGAVEDEEDGSDGGIILDQPQKEEKKKWRSALGRIKSKVRKGKKRRNQGRGRLGSSASASSCYDGMVPGKKVSSSNFAAPFSFCADSLNDDRNCVGVKDEFARPSDHQFAGVRKQQSMLDQHKELLSSLVSETKAVSARADQIYSRISKAQEEIRELELILTRSIERLQSDTALLEEAQLDMHHLERRRFQAECDIQATSAVQKETKHSCDVQGPSFPQAAEIPPPEDSFNTYSSTQLPLLPRATYLQESPNPRALRRVGSSSFMRVNDLDLEISDVDEISVVSSTSSGSLLDLRGSNPETFFYDTKAVLEALARIGYDIVTYEGVFFKPVRDTERILSKRQKPPFPAQPWHHASGKDILVWSGIVNGGGFGCSMPVIKARGIVCTSPRDVVDLMLDSSRVKEYNKMSLGRTDVVCLQRGVDTSARESAFGFPGEAKITRSINKPPVIRKSIELLSLMYARPEGDGFLMVSRSIWEDAFPHLEGTKDVIRSEMLLGVNLIRPSSDGKCEMTTITHAYSPSVPEMLAKSFAPKAAANFIRDMQACFEKN